MQNINSNNQGKLTDLPDVIAFCRAHNLPADIVGQWVWLRFHEKPSAETRALLKGAGFRWVPKRGEWAHNCGTPSRKGKYPPRFKYGSIPIGDIDLDGIKGVA